MTNGSSRSSALLLVVALALPAFAAKHKTAEHAKEAARPSEPIVLHVDLTDAPRHILHAHEQIPVTAGPLELEYPQWIPGDHRPTGPIDNLSGVFVRANGKDIPWRRDEVDMYGIHLTVPEGVTSLDVSYDFLAVPGGTGSDEDDATSANIAVLEWNSVVLYPAHVPVADIPITPSITVPDGWKSGTALTPTQQSGNETSFQTVSVYTLVDSPFITGRYFREIPLAPEITPKHYLDVAGEAPEDVEIKPAILDSFSRLVREASTLYQSHHYETYHFVLSLSDNVRGEGLEHHQSSDNGLPEHGLSDESLEPLEADLLPHEFTHSWNGKYRRPVGLATPDYATPQRGDLLWVYEGMTQYWGQVLTTRSGLWTPDQFKEGLALTAANLDQKPGRTWRNLEDTAIAAQILRGNTQNYSNWRRSQDYYPEGQLLWLDADTTIRQLTHGQKSLNDFAAKFLAVGGNTPPKVLPYTFDDIVDGLNSVVAYDWRGFLTERLTSHVNHAPLGGIEHGGYKLVYQDQPSKFEKAELGRRGGVDAYYSIGLRLTKDGMIADVKMFSDAYKAGFAPQWKIVAVNGVGYSDDDFKNALKTAKNTSEPIEFIVSNDNHFRTLKVDYHGGEKYPHLERDASKPDLLDDILKPLAPEAAPIKR
ncbi:MAG: M61 family metallopeptidase [Acidobacteriaceae bacterium]